MCVMRPAAAASVRWSRPCGVARAWVAACHDCCLRGVENKVTKLPCSRVTRKHLYAVSYRYYTSFVCQLIVSNHSGCSNIASQKLGRTQLPMHATTVCGTSHCTHALVPMGAHDTIAKPDSEPCAITIFPPHCSTERSISCLVTFADGW
jgi:hypothetical protein